MSEIIIFSFKDLFCRILAQSTDRTGYLHFQQPNGRQVPTGFYSVLYFSALPTMYCLIYVHFKSQLCL